uniref:Uncharacterized protein n=1 Tax=Favella ehrenbergii TaxID=182087 RepID=A0A7S3MLC8_9SPIT|mmetsp:Transcript_25481/g.34043  ORF Transcript_25481/g.34043 Transcript_25481/m.34043 type:complete len:104 (+) Transcript_25481:40-351(+)
MLSDIKAAKEVQVLAQKVSEAKEEDKKAESAQSPTVFGFDLDDLDLSDRALLARRMTLGVGALHLFVGRPFLRTSWRACLRNTTFFYVGSSLALKQPQNLNPF